jgi:phosphate transport system permease protein
MTALLPMDVMAETRPVEPPVDIPRVVRRGDPDDRLSLVGAAVGSLALVWIAYSRLLPFHGRLGFVLCWYVGFLALYTTLSAWSQPRPIVVERVARAVICGGAAVVAMALISAVVFTFVRGWRPLVHPNFFLHDMNGVKPQDGLSHGGAAHAVVGTFIELIIAVAISLPLGVAAAVYMTEVGGRLALVVRTVVEAMTALPDLLAGLFIYTTLIVSLGVQKSGLAAALALTITMLPIIARSAELALRVVPGGLREAGIALGSTRWRTVSRVVLPTAAPGLATALILAVARAVGETAPLLIVSGASTYFNTNPLSNPMNSLPLFVYAAEQTLANVDVQRAFGAASLLLLIVLGIFIGVRLLAGRQIGRGSR